MGFSKQLRLLITCILSSPSHWQPLYWSWWCHQMETFSALLVLCAGHRSPVNSPHKGQWRGALMFSLIYAWINGRVKDRDAGDLRRHRAHNDFIVMLYSISGPCIRSWRVANNCTVNVSRNRKRIKCLCISSPRSSPHLCISTNPWLIQIMSYRLLGDNPISWTLENKFEWSFYRNKTSWK